jgi:hypothetical protein
MFVGIEVRWGSEAVANVKVARGKYKARSQLSVID